MRKESDPIDTLRSHLFDNKLADEAQLKDIDRKIKAIVAEAADFAQKSPEPDPAELYTDVLVEV